MSEHLEVKSGRKSLRMESTFSGRSVLMIFQLPKAASRKLSLIPRNEAAHKGFPLLFNPASKLPLRTVLL